MHIPHVRSKATFLARSCVLLIPFLIFCPGFDASCKSFRFNSGGLEVFSASSGTRAQGALARAPSRSLYGIPPAEFLESAGAQQPIDPDKLDNRLLSAALFHATNLQRSKNGRQPLDHLPALDKAAQMHAGSMAAGQYLSHVDPNNPRQRNPIDRARLVGLDPQYISENVATHFTIQYESGTPVYPVKEDGKTKYYYSQGGKPIPSHTYRSFAESLVNQWMHSPEHRKNILAEQPESLGTGCALPKSASGMEKLYCVQLFHAPKDR